MVAEFVARQETGSPANGETPNQNHSSSNMPSSHGSTNNAVNLRLSVSSPALSINGNSNGPTSTGHGTVLLSQSPVSPRSPGAESYSPGYELSQLKRKELFTQRKQREFIPENKKDDSYWDRRRRNNEAAKRSREKRRYNDMVLEQTVVELTKENHVLKAQLEAIKDKFNISGENLVNIDQILASLPTTEQVLSVTKRAKLSNTVPPSVMYPESQSPIPTSVIHQSIPIDSPPSPQPQRSPPQQQHHNHYQHNQQTSKTLVIFNQQFSSQQESLSPIHQHLSSVTNRHHFRSCQTSPLHQNDTSTVVAAALIASSANGADSGSSSYGRNEPENYSTLNGNSNTNNNNTCNNSNSNNSNSNNSNSNNNSSNSNHHLHNNNNHHHQSTIQQQQHQQHSRHNSSPALNGNDLNLHNHHHHHPHHHATHLNCSSSTVAAAAAAAAAAAVVNANSAGSLLTAAAAAGRQVVTPVAAALATTQQLSTTASVALATHISYNANGTIGVLRGAGVGAVDHGNSNISNNNSNDGTNGGGSTAIPDIQQQYDHNSCNGNVLNLSRRATSPYELSSNGHGSGATSGDDDQCDNQPQIDVNNSLPLKLRHKSHLGDKDAATALLALQHIKQEPNSRASPPWDGEGSSDERDSGISIGTAEWTIQRKIIGPVNDKEENIHLKSQLARLESEVANIKNMMILNTVNPGATAAAQ